MSFSRRTPGVAVLGVFLAALPALAGSHTWSGATNGNWSVGTNWSAGGAPVNGESNVVLVFPLAQANMGAMNNDLTGLNVSSITFSDTAYAVTGNAINLAGSISMDGDGTLSGMSFQLPIVLTADSIFTTAENKSLALNAPISGPFGITIAYGAGATNTGWIALGAANTYTGVTSVSSGVLAMSNALALGAADGTPSTGTVVSSGASLMVRGTVINEALQIGGFGSGGYGAFTAYGIAEWAGPVTLTANASTDLTFETLTISGPIGEAAPGFGFKFSGGRVVLSGSNTYTGVDRLQGGTVFVNGSNMSSFETNWFGSNATAGIAILSGTGSVHGITAGGLSATNNVISPGTYAATGILTSSSVTTMNANSSLQVRLNGPNVLTDYDQLFVTVGGPTLTGSALSVTLGYAAPVGTQFTIINDGEGPPPTGTFNGLPEGAFFVVGGEKFQITYVGGPLSNNVVLTVTPTTPVELTRFSAE